MQVTVRELLGPQGVAPRIVDGWEAREAQIRMAEAILERLCDGGALVVEAPTGVGKTLAYLVPAVLSGRQVVISTNTKTLQDQIIDKDLPLLARLLDEVSIDLRRASADDVPASMAPAGEVRYALMKGRGNYLCLERLARKVPQRSFAFDDDGDLWTELTQWSQKTHRGDRAELVGLPEQSAEWDEVDARSERCHGIRCPQYDRCFVVRMRREAENAHLIVVNHHLLMADLSLRAQASLTPDGRSFGSVIPEVDCLILDEAHGVEETASTYFGGSVSNRKLERFARDVEQWANEAPKAVAPGAIRAAVDASERLFESLPTTDGRLRVPSIQGPPNQAGDRARFGEARRRLSTATDALARLADRLETLDTTTGESLARRARELGESFRFVLAADDPDYVYWAENQGKTTTLGAAPVRVGHLLTRFLFERFESVTLTSATLSAGEDACRYFKESIGAPEETDRPRAGIAVRLCRASQRSLFAEERSGPFATGAD